MPSQTCLTCGGKTNSVFTVWVTHADYRPRGCLVRWNGFGYEAGCAYDRAGKLDRERADQTIANWAIQATNVSCASGTDKAPVAAANGDPQNESEVTIQTHTVRATFLIGMCVTYKRLVEWLNDEADDDFADIVDTLVGSLDQYETFELQVSQMTYVTGKGGQLDIFTHLSQTVDSVLSDAEGDAADHHMDLMEDR